MNWQDNSLTGHNKIKTETASETTKYPTETYSLMLLLPKIAADNHYKVKEIYTNTVAAQDSEQATKREIDYAGDMTPKSFLLTSFALE